MQTSTVEVWPVHSLAGSHSQVLVHGAANSLDMNSNKLARTHTLAQNSLPNCEGGIHPTCKNSSVSKMGSCIKEESIECRKLVQIIGNRPFPFEYQIVTTVHVHTHTHAHVSMHSLYVHTRHTYTHPSHNHIKAHTHAPTDTDTDTHTNTHTHTSTHTHTPAKIF